MKKSLLPLLLLSLFAVPCKATTGTMADADEAHARRLRPQASDAEYRPIRNALFEEPLYMLDRRMPVQQPLLVLVLRQRMERSLMYVLEGAYEDGTIYRQLTREKSIEKLLREQQGRE